MLTAAIIVFCVVLFVLAFLAPRLSRHFQRAGDAAPAMADFGAAYRDRPDGRTAANLAN